MARIAFLCDQKADLHFPPHFKDVYGPLLRARGHETTILAHCLDKNSPPAQALSAEGIVLLSKDPADSMAGRIVHSLRQMAELFRILFFRKGFCDAAVFVVHNDPLAATLCWIRARLTGKKFVYRITHLMAEEALIRDDLGAHWRRIGKIAQAWRNFLIRRSDFVLPMSAEMVKSLMQQTPIDAERVLPFVSLLDFRTKHPEDVSLIASIRARMRECGPEKWLCYVGTLSPGRELNLIIETLAEIRRTDESVGLLVFGVAGKPEYLSRLKDHAGSCGVGSFILWHAPVPEDQLPHALALADVGLSPFPPNPVMRNNSPLKVMEYLRAGISAVASPIPDHEEVIRGTHGGLIADYTPVAFAQACRDLLKETPEQQAARIQTARCWLLENRDLVNGCDLLEKVIAAVRA